MTKIKTIKQAKAINKQSNHKHFIKILKDVLSLDLKKNDIIQIIDYGREYIVTENYIKLYFMNGNYKPITF